MTSAGLPVLVHWRDQWRKREPVGLQVVIAEIETSDTTEKFDASRGWLLFWDAKFTSNSIKAELFASQKTSFTR